jgi:hypothetical protein
MKSKLNYWGSSIIFQKIWWTLFQNMRSNSSKWCNCVMISGNRWSSASDIEAVFQLLTQFHSDNGRWKDSRKTASFRGHKPLHGRKLLVEQGGPEKKRPTFMAKTCTQSSAVQFIHRSPWLAISVPIHWWKCAFTVGYIYIYIYNKISVEVLSTYTFSLVTAWRGHISFFIILFS